MNWDCERTLSSISQQRLSELRNGERRALAEHLASCHDCAARIAEDQTLDRLLEAFFTDPSFAPADSPSHDETPALACSFLGTPSRDVLAFPLRTGWRPLRSRRLAWAACGLVALAASAWGVVAMVKVFKWSEQPPVMTTLTLPDGTTITNVRGETVTFSSDKGDATADAAKARYAQIVQLIKAGKATRTVSDMPDGTKLYIYKVVLPDGEVTGGAFGLPLDSPLTDEDRKKELAALVSAGKVEFVGIEEIPAHGKSYSYRVTYSDGAVEIIPSPRPISTDSLLPAAAPE